MSNKENNSPETTKRVDLFDPNCDRQLAEALATKSTIEIEISSDHGEKLVRESEDQMIKGDLMISGYVVIRIKVKPARLATYRDPITRRKAGHTSESGGRKKSFPYPNISSEDDALSTLQWRFTSCNPATLRMIALLAEPGSIQAGGDRILLTVLIRQAKFALLAFKIKRIREPLERFIAALQEEIRRLSFLLNGL